MTPQAYLQLMAELESARRQHHQEFVRWYDQANFPDIEYNAELGYLLGFLNPDWIALQQAAEITLNPGPNQ